MKKIIWFFLFCSVFLSTLHLFAKQASFEKESPRFSSAFSAGYVFKHDCRFKDVYGHGMVNVITGNFVYYPWNFWGLGLKTSYWRAKGKTTFLKISTLSEEIPVTFTLQRLFILKKHLELYVSVGAGVAWLKEKSCLEKIKLHKGIGEIELGLNYPISQHFKVVTAFRYLFPRQSFCCQNIDVGGSDVRAGFELSF